MTSRSAAPREPADPPYARIAAELRRRIAHGELRPGDRLPSTRQISRDWRVALATATRALSVLRAEGLIEPRPGVGTVVTQAARPTPAGRRAPRRAARPLEAGAEPRRAELVQTAIEIADAEGLAAVSMRSVAAELGVATMSLYRHVASKDALILLMTDAAFAEIPAPTDAPAGWRARLTVSARLQWAAYRRHPWLAQLVSITRPLPLPNLIAHGEWALAAIDGLGLDAATMLHIHITLFSYVRGLAVNLEWEAEAEAMSGLTDEEWMDRQTPAYAALATSGSIPTLAMILERLAPGYDLDLDHLFEFGLAALLDGLAPRLDGAHAR